MLLIKLHFLVTFIAVIIPSVSTIKCLRCNTVQNSDCLQGKMEAVDCPSSNHTFCTTFSGLLNMKRLFLLLRDCSSIHMGNNCRLLPDDPYNISSEQLTFCYSTCNQDGCNKDLLRLPITSNSFQKNPNYHFYLIIFLYVLNW